MARFLHIYCVNRVYQLSGSNAITPECGFKAVYGQAREVGMRQAVKNVNIKSSSALKK
jgi:hypothetical protein